MDALHFIFHIFLSHMQVSKGNQTEKGKKMYYCPPTQEKEGLERRPLYSPWMAENNGKGRWKNKGYDKNRKREEKSQKSQLFCLFVKVSTPCTPSDTLMHSENDD